MKLTLLILLCTVSLLNALQNPFLDEKGHKEKFTTFEEFIKKQKTTAKSLKPEETISIKESTAKYLFEIKSDAKRLRYFLKGVFIATGKKNDPTIKPSEILKFFMLEENITIDINFQYMNASQYINSILTKNFTDHNGTFENELNQKFQEKYLELNDLQKTWEWFDKYFKKEGLVKYLTLFQQEIIKSDQKIQELAALGIYIEGDTLYISPQNTGPEVIT